MRAVNAGIDEVSDAAIVVHEVTLRSAAGRIGPLPNVVGFLISGSLRTFQIFSAGELIRRSMQVCDRYFQFVRGNINGVNVVEPEQNRTEHERGCECAEENCNLLRAWSRA